jgi:hypothetical protein
MRRMPSGRRSISVSTALVALLFATPVAAGASGTTPGAHMTARSTPTQVVVSSFSEKGDLIDRGVSTVYQSRWTTIVATTTDILLVHAAAPGQPAASYEFAPVAGEQFGVGTYSNVQRAPTRSAGFPGLNVTGAGQPTGCVRVNGRFRVWDLAADPHGVITRLDLTWTEHCVPGRASNFGEVLINDAPQIGELITTARHVDFPDQTPQLPYLVVNPGPQAQNISLWQPTTTVSLSPSPR